MKLLLTMHAAYLTGNEVADAVMEYDLALSRAHRVAAVSVPFIDAGETRREARFTIGWQMGTSTITQSQPTDDGAFAAETISALRMRTASLEARTAEPIRSSEVAIDWPRFE
jgi:hypothetical protein